MVVFFEKIGVYKSKNGSGGDSYCPNIYTKKEALEFISRLTLEKDMPYDFSMDKQIKRAYDFAFGQLGYEDSPLSDNVRGCILRTFCFYSGSIKQAALDNKLFLNPHLGPFEECYFDRSHTRRALRTRTTVYDQEFKNDRFCSECENKLCERCLKGYPKVLASYGNAVALCSALLTEAKDLEFLIRTSQYGSVIAIFWIREVLNPLIYQLLNMKNYDGDWDHAASQIIEFAYGLENFIDRFQDTDVNELVQKPVIWATQLIFDVLKSTHLGVVYPYGDKSVPEMVVFQTSKTLSAVWSNLLTNEEIISFSPTDYQKIADRIATVHNLPNK